MRKSKRVGERKAKIQEEQQIVVLKMWEKCGFLLRMQNTHLHKSNLPFFAICIPLLNCFASVIFVKLPLSLGPFSLLLFPFTLFVDVSFLPLDNRILFEWNCRRLLCRLGLYRFHFEWMLCARLSTITLFLNWKTANKRFTRASERNEKNEGKIELMEKMKCC